jgi:hypothetical protein
VDVEQETVARNPFDKARENIVLKFENYRHGMLARELGMSGVRRCGGEHA